MASTISGELVRLSAENKNILAFISVNSERSFPPNALVLIPGLSDGMMSMNYTVALNSALLSIDYSLVQVNLSSSFLQFGLHTLATDVHELSVVVRYLKDTCKFKRLILLGHSTGCQDSLYFLKHSPYAEEVNAVILQGAISDRDGITTLENSSQLLAEAKSLSNRGIEDALLGSLYDGAPITVRRCLSLAGRLTPDDMFSNDLTTEELTPILAPVTVPILLCYSEGDEYVLDKPTQKKTAQRIANTLLALKNTSVVESIYIAGDHGLSKEKFYIPFIDKVLSFIKKNNYCSKIN